MKSFLLVIVGATLSLSSALQAQTIGPLWSERLVTIKAGDTPSTILSALGATSDESAAIAVMLSLSANGGGLQGKKLRVLLSPVRDAQRLQPVRVTLMDGEAVEAVVALSDRGMYVHVDVLRSKEQDGTLRRSDHLEAPSASTRFVLADEVRSARPADPLSSEAGDRPRAVRTVAVPASAGGAPSPEVAWEFLQVLRSPTEMAKELPSTAYGHPLLWFKSWPDAAPVAASPTPAPSAPIHLKLNLPALARPTWTWPPQNFWWALAPGSQTASRIWQLWSQPAWTGTIRMASTFALASPRQPALPSWLQSMSAVTTSAGAAPPWPRVPPPDFPVLAGPSRFASERYLEPPPKFVRWSDRVESVLADVHEVDRHCLAIGAKRHSAGRVYRGCAHRVAGRCLVIRVDDPGVARHELAHCNGWKHPEP